MLKLLCSVRFLWVLVLLSASACVAPVEEEGEEMDPDLVRLGYGDDAARWQQGRVGWGSQRTLGAPWVQDQARVVTSIESPNIFRVPNEQTLLLGVKYQLPDGIPTQVGILRWLIELGTGGARESYLIDAINLQQVSVPFESVRVSIVAQGINGAFSYTDQLVIASVAIGDGNSGTHAAQFTQFFNVPGPGPDVDIVIPKGASAFRVAGLPGGASDPFAADITYTYRQAGGLFFDQFTGTDMLAVHSTDMFIPLAGTPDVMRISPGAAAGAFGALVWSLEL